MGFTRWFHKMIGDHSPDDTLIEGKYTTAELQRAWNDDSGVTNPQQPTSRKTEFDTTDVQYAQKDW
jgi:hypothetical protein